MELLTVSGSFGMVFDNIPPQFRGDYRFGYHLFAVKPVEDYLYYVPGKCIDWSWERSQTDWLSASISGVTTKSMREEFSRNFTLSGFISEPRSIMTKL